MPFVQLGSGVLALRERDVKILNKYRERYEYNDESERFRPKPDNKGAPLGQGHIVMWVVTLSGVASGCAMLFLIGAFVAPLSTFSQGTLLFCMVATAAAGAFVGVNLFGPLVTCFVRIIRKSLPAYRARRADKVFAVMRKTDHCHYDPFSLARVQLFEQWHLAYGWGLDGFRKNHEDSATIGDELEAFLVATNKAAATYLLDSWTVEVETGQDGTKQCLFVPPEGAEVADEVLTLARMVNESAQQHVLRSTDALHAAIEAERRHYESIEAKSAAMAAEAEAKAEFLARQKAGAATRQALDFAEDLHGENERMRAYRRLNPPLSH